MKCILYTKIRVINFRGSTWLKDDTCQSRPKSSIKGGITQPHPRVPANCSALMFSGNNSEIRRVERELRSWQNSVFDQQFLQRLTNCTYTKSLFSDELYR